MQCAPTKCLGGIFLHSLEVCFHFAVITRIPRKGRLKARWWKKLFPNTWTQTPPWPLDPPSLLKNDTSVRAISTSSKDHHQQHLYLPFCPPPRPPPSKPPRTHPPPPNINQTRAGHAKKWYDPYCIGRSYLCLLLHSYLINDFMNDSSSFYVLAPTWWWIIW